MLAVVAGHGRPTATTPGGAGGTSWRRRGVRRAPSGRLRPTTTAGWAARVLTGSSRTQGRADSHARDADRPSVTPVGAPARTSHRHMSPVSAAVVPPSSRPVISSSSGWWSHPQRGSGPKRGTRPVDFQPMRLRLRRAPARPPVPAPAGPVVLVLPARDEGGRVGAVIDRLPTDVLGRPTRCIFVDDGSVDDTAAVASAHGATVVRHNRSAGLGAAVRDGLAAAVASGAAVVAFCDADGEYDPAELARLAAPILEGRADYVVGSRFRGSIDRMRPHRRLGNRLLTVVLRIIAREPISDGQSGFRALSSRAAADAHIAHDYNYAQVLTLDLLGRGYRYAEVPITYSFREGGRSFVRLGSYLRAVGPAVWRTVQASGPAPGGLS